MIELFFLSLHDTSWKLANTNVYLLTHTWKTDGSTIDYNNWICLSSCSFGLGAWGGHGSDGKTLGVISKWGNMEGRHKVERDYNK